MSSNDNHYRRTGKTFRNLCKAVILLSEGLKCVYITSTHAASVSAFYRAIDILNSQRIEHESLRKHTGKITMSNGGEIVFKSEIPSDYEDAVAYSLGISFRYITDF